MKLFFSALLALSCVVFMGASTAHDEFTTTMDVDIFNRSGGHHEIYIDVESLGYTNDDYAVTIHVTPWDMGTGIPSVPVPGNEVEVWDSGSRNGLSPFSNTWVKSWTSDPDTNGEHPKADYMYEVKAKLWKWDPNGCPDPLWVKIDEQTVFEVVP